MTNDDRSNEDPPADGQAPSWGSAPDASSADAPRYGERAEPASAPQYGEQGTTPRYGEQGDAPRYGEQTAAPQYGSEQYREQQGQYGQAQYGQGQHDDRSGAPAWNHDHQQQPYAAAAATNHGGPSWQQFDEPKPAKKKTVGVVAFVLGLASVVIGVVGGWLMGSALAGSSAIRDLVPTDGSTPDQSQLQQQLMNDPNVISQLGTGAIVAGIAAILGVWALVQGIVAIATKRGRGWGVFAIILAVVATIATFATYVGVAAAAAVGNAS